MKRADITPPGVAVYVATPGDIAKGYDNPDRARYICPDPEIRYMERSFGGYAPSPRGTLVRVVQEVKRADPKEGQQPTWERTRYVPLASIAGLYDEVAPGRIEYHAGRKRRMEELRQEETTARLHQAHLIATLGILAERLGVQVKTHATRPDTVEVDVTGAQLLVDAVMDRLDRP